MRHLKVKLNSFKKCETANEFCTFSFFIEINTEN